MRWFARSCGSAVVAGALVMLTGCGMIGGGDKGDEYTVLLRTFQSAQHNEDARFYRDQLELADWEDVVVVHKDGHSELFWGKYGTPAAGREDTVKAQRYADKRGGRPFRHARLVLLPGKDVGPPEWKLVKAKGTYTVVVGYYYDVPKESYTGRRRKAVEQCKVLRDRKYEAYYHHGPVKSYVTVGTFGPKALQTVWVHDTIQKVVADIDIENIMREFRTLQDNGNSRVIFVNQRIPGTDQARRKRVYERPYVVDIPRRTDDDLTTRHRAGVWKLR